MSNKRQKPEKIVQKLRQVDVLVGQRIQRLDAIREVRIVFARLALNAPNQLFSGLLRCSGCLIHLRSITASMNQKSSLAQPPNSVR